MTDYVNRVIAFTLRSVVSTVCNWAELRRGLASLVEVWWLSDMSNAIHEDHLPLCCEHEQVYLPGRKYLQKKTVGHTMLA
jgi:hypothetical protein